MDNKIAMTGEVSIYGDVLPVGGVSAKIEGAKEAGATKVLIPADNWQAKYENMEIEVKPIHTLKEVITELFDTEQKENYALTNTILTATSFFEREGKEEYLTE